MACLINRDHSFIFEIAPKYCISNSFDGYESAAFNMPANLENTAVTTGLENSVFISIPKKGNAKECSNYCMIALVSQASKVMLKIFHVRLQLYVNHEFPDVQAGFRKGRGTRLPTSNFQHLLDHRKSKRVPEKHLFLLC